MRGVVGGEAVGRGGRGERERRVVNSYGTCPFLGFDKMGGFSSWFSKKKKVKRACLQKDTQLLGYVFSEGTCFRLGLTCGSGHPASNPWRSPPKLDRLL